MLYGASSVATFQIATQKEKSHKMGFILRGIKFMLTNVSTAKSIVKLGISRKMCHRIQAFFLPNPK